MIWFLIPILKAKPNRVNILYIHIIPLLILIFTKLPSAPPSNPNTQLPISFSWSLSLTSPSAAPSVSLPSLHISHHLISQPHHHIYPRSSPFPHFKFNDDPPPFGASSSSYRASLAAFYLRQTSLLEEEVLQCIAATVKLRAASIHHQHC